MKALKRIFIIGHLGALKSATGEALAKRLGWQLIDANPGLERYIGRDFHEMLGAKGEAAFHQCEAQIISYYKSKEQVVVILEEAVIATEENRQLLSQEYVVYLSVTIKQQIESWPNGRVPLLPIINLPTFLEQQHRERDSLFEEVATLTIESISTEENVNQIIRAMTSPDT